MTFRTPPEIKWLLVQRATVAGEISRLQDRQALLSQELASYQAQLTALDTTLLRIEQSINVGAAGTIRAHDRYGKRGELKEFIVGLLKAAAPETIDTPTIVRKAIVQFNIEFEFKGELRTFMHNSIRRTILALKEQGLVEALHGTKGRATVGIWRWKSELPTFAELAALTTPA